MSSARKIFAALLIVGFSIGPIQSQELPQTQGAAAAVLALELLGMRFDSRYVSTTITIIDDRTAQLHGWSRFTGVDFKAAADWPDIVVRMQGDCLLRAETVPKGNAFTKEKTPVETLLLVRLDVLSNEWQYGEYAMGSLSRGLMLVVTGNGRDAAMCQYYPSQPFQATPAKMQCYRNLTIKNSNATNEMFDRSVRALKFLTQSCPPQQLPF